LLSTAVVFLPATEYHSIMENDEDRSDILSRLHAMQIEHRDLDAVIGRLVATPPGDELLLQRLKKRKLLLKDRISQLERMLEPDIPA